MKITDWMKPYLKHLTNTGGNDPQELLDDLKTDKHMASSNIVRFTLASCVLAQVQFLARLNEGRHLIAVPLKLAPAKDFARKYLLARETNKYTSLDEEATELLGGIYEQEPGESAGSFYFVELDPETDKPLKGSTGFAVHKDSDLVADGFEYVQYAAMFAGLANAVGPDEAAELMRMLRKVPEFSYPAK